MATIRISPSVATPTFKAQLLLASSGHPTVIVAKFRSIDEAKDARLYLKKFKAFDKVMLTVCFT